MAEIVLQVAVLAVRGRLKLAKKVIKKLETECDLIVTKEKLGMKMILGEIVN